MVKMRQGTARDGLRHLGHLRDRHPAARLGRAGARAAFAISEGRPHVLDLVLDGAVNWIVNALLASHSSTR